MNDEIARLRAECANLRSALAEVLLAGDALTTEIRAYRTSTSWRATGPLRAIGRAARAATGGRITIRLPLQVATGRRLSLRPLSVTCWSGQGRWHDLLTFAAMRRTLRRTSCGASFHQTANQDDPAAHASDRDRRPTNDQHEFVQAPSTPPLQVSVGVPNGGTRSFASIVPTTLWDAIQQGTLGTHYRGTPCLKSPFDLVLYIQLIGRQLPTIRSSASGGSALWFADLLTCHGIVAPRVVSVGIELPTNVFDDRIPEGQRQSVG